MRVLFAGTPSAAVPSLRALAGSQHDVVAVLTRPDAPTGRGRTVAPSAVRVVADELGVEVLTPARLRDESFRARLAELSPDVAAVVAYGALVPPDLLAAVPHGWVNLHFSLLPAWRGAAPVQRALIAGDDVTGATTFLLEEGMDTGPVYGVLTETVKPWDTAGDLLQRLSIAGARLLVSTVDGIESGDLVPQPQPAEGVSIAPKVTVEDARVDWTAPAIAIDRLIRGCTPDPGAWTTHREQRLKLGPVRPTDVELPAGEIAAGKDGVLVGTATTAVRLGDVQPPGKKSMPAADWARGARLAPGERCV